MFAFLSSRSLKLFSLYSSSFWLCRNIHWFLRSWSYCFWARTSSTFSRVWMVFIICFSAFDYSNSSFLTLLATKSCIFSCSFSKSLAWNLLEGLNSISFIWPSICFDGTQNVLLKPMSSSGVVIKVSGVGPISPCLSAVANLCWVYDSVVQSLLLSLTETWSILTAPPLNRALVLALGEWRFSIELGLGGPLACRFDLA